jgi:hypothetical protein
VTVGDFVQVHHSQLKTLHGINFHFLFRNCCFAKGGALLLTWN